MDQKRGRGRPMKDKYTKLVQHNFSVLPWQKESQKFINYIKKCIKEYRE